MNEVIFYNLIRVEERLDQMNMQEYPGDNDDDGRYRMSDSCTTRC